MEKKEYKFNPQTLTYEVVTAPFKLRYYRLLRKILVAFILASIFNAIFSCFFYTPKLYRIHRENNELVIKYRILQSKIDASMNQLNEIKHRVAHNLYLDNLITLGIVGLTLQLATQGTVLHIFRKHRKYELMGAFIGMMGMCLSLSLTASKPIWNMMLIALALDCNPVALGAPAKKQENQL